jgi:DNA-binding CsgD family transcriptional regulator
MASSDNGAGGSQSPAPEVIEAIRKSSLPALLLEIPGEKILAASRAAQELLGAERKSVEGHSFEDFTSDEPSGALDLILAGRLQGYETSRQLPADDEGSIPARVWVRAFDDDIPTRRVLAIISADAESTPTYVPTLAEGELPPLIGTANENLLIDRISSDVETFLGYAPEEVLGQSLLSLVSAEDTPKWLLAIAQATIARGGVTLNVQALPADSRAIVCDAFLLAMLPAPACAFVLMPRRQGSETGAGKRGVVEQLSRLNRGARAVSLSADLATSDLHRVPGSEQLSPRELDVVRRLLTGDRVPAIAKALFLSQSTIRNHLARVYRKLGVGSQQGLIDLLRRSDADS